MIRGPKDEQTVKHLNREGARVAKDGKKQGLRPRVNEATPQTDEV